MNIAPKTILVEDALEQPVSVREAWYLDPKALRPKKQFRWTLKERATLYKMRVIQKKSIMEIQRYFRKLNNIPIVLGENDNNDKFSRTRLHNQIRMIRGSFNGLCHRCRKPLSKNDLKRSNRDKEREDPSIALCEDCLKETSKYKKKKRRKALKNGICTICEKEKSIEGHTMCRACISATHRHRYLEGLCGRCGKHPLDPHSISLCKSCLKKVRKNSREYRITHN